MYLLVKYVSRLSTITPSQLDGRNRLSKETTDTQVKPTFHVSTLVVNGVELVHAAQVLLQDVLVGESLVAVLHGALVAIRHLVDAVLVQRQAALPGKHLMMSGKHWEYKQGVSNTTYTLQ